MAVPRVIKCVRFGEAVRERCDNRWQLRAGLSRLGAEAPSNCEGHGTALDLDYWGLCLPQASGNEPADKGYITFISLQPCPCPCDLWLSLP
jgi:hypothetical protein